MSWACCGSGGENMWYDVIVTLTTPTHLLVHATVFVDRYNTSKRRRYSDHVLHYENPLRYR